MSKIKVLADYHHEDLYESLRILFEDRLDFELYRGIGVDWYREGFWSVYEAEDTANQYLGLHLGQDLQLLQKQAGKTWLNLNHMEEKAGVYFVPRHGPNTIHKAITLQAFKDTKFDVIVSSMPGHYSRFEDLKNRFQPQAKHIFQMGNNWSIPGGVRNLLNSTTVGASSDINTVYYHQEFSLKRFYPESPLKIKSLANLQHYMHDRGRFEQLRSMMPDWEFKAYGAGNPDGSLDPETLDRDMRQLGFIWHVKQGGEGYGYNIHYGFACGKPIVLNTSGLGGFTAGKLFSDTTIINIDEGLDRVREKLNTWADNYDSISKIIKQKFDEVVNFDQEFLEIKKFMDRLC